MMRLRRLGRPGERPVGVEISYFYLSFGSLLRHLRRLPGLDLKRSFAWPLTDDYMAEFSYKGHDFDIGSFFVDYDVTWKDDCPEDVFQEVVRHLESYRPWRIAAWLAEWEERRRTSKAARLAALAKKAEGERQQMRSDRS